MPVLKTGPPQRGGRDTTQLLKSKHDPSSALNVQTKTLLWKPVLWMADTDKGLMELWKEKSLKGKEGPVVKKSTQTEINQKIRIHSNVKC